MKATINYSMLNIIKFIGRLGVVGVLSLLALTFLAFTFFFIPYFTIGYLLFVSVTPTIKMFIESIILVIVSVYTFIYLKKYSYSVEVLEKGNYLPDEKDWAFSTVGKPDTWVFLLAEQGYLRIEEKGKSFYMIKLKNYDGNNKSVASWFNTTFRKNDIVRCYRPFVNGDFLFKNTEEKKDSSETENIEKQTSKCKSNKTKETNKLAEVENDLALMLQSIKSFLIQNLSTLIEFWVVFSPCILMALWGGAVFVIFGGIGYAILVIIVWQRTVSFQSFNVLFVPFFLMMIITNEKFGKSLVAFNFNQMQLFDIIVISTICFVFAVLVYKSFFFIYCRKDFSPQTLAFILFIKKVIRHKDVLTMHKIYLNDEEYGLKVLPYVTHLRYQKKWLKIFPFLYDEHPKWLNLKYGTYLDFLKKL